MWVLVVLRAEPATPACLLDAVRALDGNIGPGTLFGALARLERLALIDRMVNGDGRAAYRLTDTRVVWPAGGAR
jgi:DNA-binding PadR family transcriptional regulator